MRSDLLVNGLSCLLAVLGLLAMIVIGKRDVFAGVDRVDNLKTVIFAVRKCPAAETGQQCKFAHSGQFCTLVVRNVGA